MPSDRAGSSVDEMERAIACLAVEVPGEVWDDVYAKWSAVRDEYERLRKIAFDATLAETRTDFREALDTLGET